MKKKEFEAIGKQLSPDLPGFAVNGNLLFMRPIDHILRAICFARSIDPKSFYVEVFVQPLFVPAQYLGFNFGRRLGGGCCSWNADNPNLVAELSAGLKRDALPFLLRIQTMDDFVGVAESFSMGNPHTPRAIAYALACAGRINEAVEVLDKLPNQINLEVPWQRDMADQARALNSLLRTDPAAAQRQLDAWEAETVKNLGLEEFWDGGNHGKLKACSGPTDCEAVKFHDSGSCGELQTGG